MPQKNITAKFVFYENWPTQGNGNEDDPYLISSADDWNKFAHNVTYGRNYSGQYVKLTNDISVTTMAGGYQDDDNYQPFSGTFDGDSTGANNRVCFQIIGASSPNDLRQTKSSGS